MRCSRIKRRLSAFLDDELPESKKRSVSEHLRSCDSCRLELEELVCVKESIDLLEELEVPPCFAVAVKEKALAEYRGLRKLPLLERLKHGTVPAVTTAAVCLSLLIGTMLGRGIYQLRAERTSKQEVEFVTFLGTGSFVNVSDGSLVSAYNDLMAVEGE